MSPNFQKAHHHPPEGSPLEAYSPTDVYDDNDIGEFYDQQQNVIDQTPTKDILVVQGDWNAKVGKDDHENWKSINGPSALTKQMGEDSDSTVNDLVSLRNVRAS